MIFITDHNNNKMKDIIYRNDIISFIKSEGKNYYSNVFNIPNALRQEYHTLTRNLNKSFFVKSMTRTNITIALKNLR